jgi:ClpP class serine protease
MWPFSKSTVIPVLRFTGPIGMVTPLRPGLSLATAAGQIDKAFGYTKAPAVVVAINSPGGSPVQSSLIFKRIRQLAEEKNKRVLVFCEDVAASGSYYLAIAATRFTDASSIIGSIGVISAGFGFDKAIGNSASSAGLCRQPQQERARPVPTGKGRRRRAAEGAAARRP